MHHHFRQWPLQHSKRHCLLHRRHFCQWLGHPSKRHRLSHQIRRLHQLRDLCRCAATDTDISGAGSRTVISVTSVTSVSSKLTTATTVAVEACRSHIRQLRLDALPLPSVARPTVKASLPLASAALLSVASPPVEASAPLASDPLPSSAPSPLSACSHRR